MAVGSGEGGGGAPPDRLAQALSDVPQVVRYQDVAERASSYMSEDELRAIQRAYVFSAKAHEGQSRRSGEPYLVHPIAVAEILASQGMDVVTVVAGFLHDVLEDTAAEREEIRRIFGDDVLHVVEGVTKLAKLEYSTREEVQAASFRKMLLAMADDLRVIIVKLADRLHNMRTLGHMPAAKRARIGQETAEIYSPMAHRLGMGRLRNELDDLAFQHVAPERHAELVKQLAERRQVEKGFLRRTEKQLAEILGEAGIECAIKGRRKSLASIDRKLVGRKIEIDEVHDYLAFRVITAKLQDCYASLGVIHARWTPIQARFKDFIATPKPNGYRSLHTTVVSDDGHPFEIQIRTEEMHLVAEEGVAAHWAYKEGTPTTLSEAQQFSWLRNLVDAGQDVRDPQEFMQAVKINLFGDEVYCFTPGGDVKVLPAGATGVDFAYAIHSEVGDHCTGVKIDGHIQPLRTKLEHGNRVEILTSASQSPSRDWLSFVVTGRARSKIRSYFHAKERESTLERGRQELDKEARKVGKTGPKLLRSKEAASVLGELKMDTGDELLLAIGHDHLSARAFVNRVVAPESEPPPEPQAIETRRARLGRTRQKKGAKGRGPVVADSGSVTGILTFLAKCCRPVRGEPIRGFVTRGRGVSVHREGCRSLASAKKDGRLIEVSWDPLSESSFEVKLRIRVSDRSGILGDVTTALAGLGVNIRSAEARTQRSGQGYIAVVVEVHDISRLEEIRRVMLAVNGVLEVQR